ncbi:undecaprenyl-diphosphate phosphatase [Sanguibacter hominis ATCC BAA-789]|uniref:Undecaprenyl-diphosphatase n=1 Tax=Sanguibacter hominis ATCC BAA-789 TaxID=1312740 RepID=A0A9X5FFQ7_9MICO|nr:undecaprenyl-diphosphate phosphatase [Sanguibacter hominis ATCC BAA-789]
MNVWEAIVLGLVQGLTEFLPISSSAHLRIVGELIGSSDPGAAFTAITQIGTETAVVLYFRKDIARICAAWWRALTGAHGTGWRARLGEGDPDARMAWWIALGSVPIVAGGLFLEDAIDATFRNLYLTALTLAVFGILLGVADRFARQERTLDTIGPRHAILFGLAQAMALVPGVSRSGGTITMGRLLGYTREAAARYSFLLAIPAVLGSGLYKLVGSFDELGTAGTPGLLPILVATVIAFVVGYAVIIWFLKLVSTRSYLPFVIYRLVLAVVVVILLGAGAVTATGGV